MKQGWRLLTNGSILVIFKPDKNYFFQIFPERDIAYMYFVHFFSTIISGSISAKRRVLLFFKLIFTSAKLGLA